MTIVLGYWLIPAVITAALYAWTFLTPAEPLTGGYFDIPDPMPLVRFATSTIGSLIVWLFYFIILFIKK